MLSKDSQNSVWCGDAIHNRPGSSPGDDVHSRDQFVVCRGSGECVRPTTGEGNHTCSALRCICYHCREKLSRVRERPVVARGGVAIARAIGCQEADVTLFCPIVEQLPEQVRARGAMEEYDGSPRRGAILSVGHIEVVIYRHRLYRYVPTETPPICGFSVQISHDRGVGSATMSVLSRTRPAFYQSGCGCPIMKRASIRVTYDEEDAHPIHRQLMHQHGIDHAKLLMWGPISSITTFAWFDGPRDAIGGILDSIHAISTFHLLPDTDGTYAFIDQERYEFSTGVMALLSQSSVVFVPPVEFFESGAVLFEAVGEPGSLSEFYSRLNRTVEAEIESVSDYKRRPTGATLTSRQRTALDIAIDVGYYDVPRSGSLSEIASQLDCAKSTAGELLRKAESEVIHTYVDTRER